MAVLLLNIDPREYTHAGPGMSRRGVQPTRLDQRAHIRLGGMIVVVLQRGRTDTPTCPIPSGSFGAER
jgi:hypothetical protein